jgi:molecular chaperone DnaJ
VDTGSRLRSVGNGEAGVAGGEAGDLYIVLSVRDHELFERQGDDLFCEIPIKFTLATLGGTIEVPTLFGRASLKLPAGTQSGTTFRLRGKGMPSLRNRGDQGDQLVRVHVEVPQSLTAEQRRILEQFAQVSGDAENPTSKSWFEKAKKFF